MANYSNLKAAIQAVISENHNNEITGIDLQNVLISMINALVGYQFVGIATPTTNPGTPDQNIYYLASQDGTYTNFGGLILNNEIAAFIYDGSWHKLNTGIATKTQVDELQSKSVDIDITNGILTYMGVKYQLIRIYETMTTSAIMGVAIMGQTTLGTI